MNTIGIKLLSYEDVQNSLNMREVIDITLDVYRRVGEGKIICPPKVSMELPGNNEQDMNWINSMPSLLLDENIAGIKWVNVTSANRQKGIPVTIGTIILNDATTAVPLAIVDGTWITHMRTGASVAIGAKLLARKDSKVATIVGAGSEGRTALSAILEEFALEQVNIVDIDTTAAERFAESSTDKYSSTKFSVQASIQDSVKDSDIIILTTTARKALMMREWAKPGDFICTISCMTDLDFDFVGRSDKFIVDDTHCTLKRISAMAGLEVKESEIHGDICQIASGQLSARENNDELITYAPAGMGAIDLAVALTAYKKSGDKCTKFNLING